MTERLGPAFFADLYAANPDPWDLETSPYEAAKHGAAIDVAEAALETARDRVREVAFELREVPEEFPDGAYDLIVASEALYCDEVHERLTKRFGPAAYTRRTDKYNLDRFDV